LIAGYPLAIKINQQGRGIFFYDNESRLRLSIEGVHFFVNFTDELFVINEVFVAGEYNFRSMDEIVVIDVGLNIGATSLFFARQKNVRRVYAYELFEPTFLAAQKNLSINDSSKIVRQNVGLGKESRQLRIQYSSANKATMGLKGLPDAYHYPDAEEVSVSLIDVAEEVKRISELEPDVKKVCKMDCEGAEFEILDQLFKQKAISLIDTYIIEWHLKSTQQIEMQFLENGFDLIKPSGNGQTGLIYAFKRKEAL
jgi:FkbM family methyltransferase